ncbi:DExH-box splicing factor binding site-domain-containing protein [Naematelia encephala]|uniref:DExH-box splicing factor binding site-domain-containing protein n=1 Tax=Naematelia encephala TaxID=71784 RepID=A0A1Y2B939_9TREE|nr:DExH-box splicing factor binding site-domain-containing protein [Naematelia encephala]
MVNMTTPISFTVRPPSSSNYRPSPLGNGGHRGAPSRRLFEQGDEDEDEEGGRRAQIRNESIEGFRNGRAVGGEKPQGPLVIPSLPNRDWRQAARRTPTYRPESRDQGAAELETHERTGDGPQRSGLRFASKAEEEQAVKGDVKPKLEELDSTPVSTPTNGSGNGNGEVKKEPLTLEQQALQALLAGDQPESEQARLEQEMIISSSTNRPFGGPPTEEDAFRRDMETLPEESTVEDYSAVPVEAFGLAMLRGMGWDPKSSQGTTVHAPKQRPQLLGLGATPMDVTIRPTHGKKKDKKDYKERSGRGFVASNLLLKKEREGSGSGSVTPVDSRVGSPRRRDDEVDSGRDSKRRDREEDDRRRDRNGDSSRDDGGRARREYETDEERARRKEKERAERYSNGDRDRYSNGDRDRYSNGDRDRDRYSNGDKERSRYRDDDRAKGRDRERERDRDDRDRRRDIERDRR